MFTIGVDLVKPCTLSGEKHVLDPQEAQKLERIPFPNDRIQRRVEDWQLISKSRL